MVEKTLEKLQRIEYFISLLIENDDPLDLSDAEDERVEEYHRYRVNTQAIKDELTEIISKRVKEKNKKAEQDKHVNILHENISTLSDRLISIEKEHDEIVVLCKEVYEAATVKLDTYEATEQKQKEVIAKLKAVVDRNKDKTPIKKVKPRIIIVILGGLVNDVYSNLEEADIDTLYNDGKDGNSDEELQRISDLQTVCGSLNAIY